MGFTSALVTAALAVGASMHTQNKAKKAQQSAEIAAREAAKRNVTVQSSAAEPVRAEAANVEAGEVARQNARKRRQGIASTVSAGALTSSLVGNKSRLGG